MKISLTKTALMISIISLLIGINSQARQGENDGGNHKDDGRLIQCTDKTTGNVLLQFQSTQTQGQIATADLELVVKTKGDDIGEITLIDRRSADSIKAKRLEELLKTTLISNETSVPLILESATHKGYGEMQILEPTTGDQAKIKSLSHQGQSYMDIEFITNENSNSPIHILCQKIR
jgi:hypothetical protein